MFPISKHESEKPIERATFDHSDGEETVDSLAFSLTTLDDIRQLGGVAALGTIQE